jgi:hypothetical protein
MQLKIRWNIGQLWAVIRTQSGSYPKIGHLHRVCTIAQL